MYYSFPFSSHGKYEYLYKRPSNSKLFAGIYFDPADPGNSPQFVYNSDQGSPYTGNLHVLYYIILKSMNTSLIQCYLIYFNSLIR